MAEPLELLLELEDELKCPLELLELDEELGWPEELLELEDELAWPLELLELEDELERPDELLELEDELLLPVPGPIWTSSMPVPVVGFRLREYCLLVELFQCSCTPRLPRIAVLPEVGR